MCKDRHVVVNQGQLDNNNATELSVTEQVKSGIILLRKYKTGIKL